MRRFRRIQIGLLVAAIGSALIVSARPQTTRQPVETTAPQLPQQTPTQVVPTGQPKPDELFNGVTSLRTKDGQVKEVRVVLRNWVIGNLEKIERFPQEGFQVVHLRAGNLTATIDGNRRKFFEGQFWSVPAKSFMLVETETDTAVIQTIDIQDSALAKQPANEKKPIEEKPSPNVQP